MKILSLDLSTKSSGYAIGENTTLLKHGYITASSTNPIKRIIKMREQIKKIIQQEKIQKIILQEVRNEINSHTFKILIWLQAAIIIAAYEINSKIQYDFLGASQWRAVLKIKQGRGIKRENLKPKDIQYVFEKYNIKVNDDQADAICLFDAYNILQDNEINW